jgi:hypothetical protein
MLFRINGKSGMSGSWNNVVDGSHFRATTVTLNITNGTAESAKYG